MTSYIQEQIKLIFDRHNGKLDEISIILPNKRAAVYIQKYLAELYKAPFFSPEILTINEWIKDSIDEVILNQTELLFILYHVHCEIEGNEQESFEEFMLWGKTILNDFDEIDKYMIDPGEAFRNLQDIKELESWNLEDKELGKAQIQFQKIWDKLSTYYARLEIRLNAMKATYSGRAYVNFFHNLQTHATKEHYYFLGFNALSKVEKKLMKTLAADQKATILFDIDQFYFQNESHEAGHFYRQISKEWKIKPETSSHFNGIPKQFEVIETSQQVGQAKIAGALAKRLLDEREKPGDIAIVLADESLLIPLTRSLPSDLEEANITMGWPIKFSHLKGFIDLVFDFQFSFEKFKSDQLYHKDIVNFLQHPYTQELISKSDLKETVQKEIQNGNRIFIEVSELVSLETQLEKFGMLFFQWGSDNQNRFKIFEQLIELFYQSFKENDRRKIDLEIIFQFKRGLEKFQKIMTDHEVSLTLRAFRQLFYQFWQAETLSFLGNPIEGLQVMGILETRTLDFKNVILVGMNEGSLPKSTQIPSFVPRDLRKFLGLPIEEDRQAIFAHHFYRLLHRSSTVFMTYNSNADGLSSGEKSRFIIQLENELDRSIHQYKESTFAGEDQKANTSEVVYKSTSEVHARLDALLERGLSPSALNKLIQCPLDFYYRYILKFDEADEVQENIESSTFGTKIHIVLERIIEDNFRNEDKTYSPLTIDILQKEKKPKSVFDRLESAYLKNDPNLEDDKSKRFTKADLKYGENKLSFDISRQFIETFIAKQIEELMESSDAVIPLELEKSIEASYILKIGSENKKINIKGTADRIDKKGGLYRIIDYKSGKCDAAKIALRNDIDTEEGLEKFMNDPKMGYARQLLMYALMYRAINKEVDFSAGIISMINLKDWVIPIIYNNSEVIDDGLLERFKASLLSKIAELYDPNFEFKHDPKSDYCQHCGN